MKLICAMRITKNNHFIEMCQTHIKKRLCNSCEHWKNILRHQQAGGPAFYHLGVK